jgi:hypothetical protein
MKKIVQIHKELLALPWMVKGWKKWADKIIVVNNITEYNKELPIVAWAKPHDKIIGIALKNSYPTILMNRPYLSAHIRKQIDMFRVSVNSFACSSFKEMPYSRWDKIGVDKHPWKVTEVKNILIAPPNKGVVYFTGQKLDLWVEDLQTLFKDFNVKVRLKNSTGAGRGERYSSLWNDFDWADLVVSCASASTAEAFWYGKKVISLGPCSTLMCNTGSLENFINPSEPANRDSWHEHIGWIQFLESEWTSGNAQEMTAVYQGWNTN